MMFSFVKATPIISDLTIRVRNRKFGSRIPVSDVRTVFSWRKTALTGERCGGQAQSRSGGALDVATRCSPTHARWHFRHLRWPPWS